MLHLQRPIRAACAIALVTMAAAGCADNNTESEDSAVGSTMTTGSSSSHSPTDLAPTPSPSPAPAPTARATPTPVPQSPPAVPPAPPAALPPFIASTTWDDSDYGVTLRIAPTRSGRLASGVNDSATAWQEVLRLAPDANTPGMWEQFNCHWTWARILEPNKATWNVEPWRPVVDEAQMLADGCNPGGPEV